MYNLAINDLRLWVHLGCSSEEKHHSQMISVNINIEFIQHPEGCNSDDLNDTVCYLKLTQHISSYLENKKFNLIEFLAKKIHEIIEDFVSNFKKIISSITVEIHKISPPVANVHGGVKWMHSSKY